AEDGIRDFHVTGVQTCALPISRSTRPLRFCGSRPTTPKPRSYTAYLPETAETCITRGLVRLCVYYRLSNLGFTCSTTDMSAVLRSEERRVGKECRWRESRCTMT